MGRLDEVVGVHEQRHHRIIACGSGLPQESVGLREVPRPHSVVGSKKEVDVDRAGGRRPLTCMTCPGLAYVRRHQVGEIHFSTERRRHGVLRARLSASSFPVHTRRRRSLEPHLSTRDAQHRTIDIYMTLQRGTIANCPITFVTAAPRMHVVQIRRLTDHPFDSVDLRLHHVPMRLVGNPTPVVLAVDGPSWPPSAAYTNGGSDGACSGSPTAPVRPLPSVRLRRTRRRQAGGGRSQEKPPGT